MMFQPRPRLIRAADGTYTLAVAVEVPTSCYRAGPVRPGLPDGGVGIPEITYYTLEILHDDLICAQMVHDITFTQPGVSLGSGKDGVGVVAVLDGKIVGSGLVLAHAEKGGSAKAAAAPLPGHAVLLPDSVSAIVFGGFTGVLTLRVSASVMVRTSGYKAHLRPSQPQGINPDILLLELEVQPPTGIVFEVISTISAFYVDSPYQGSHTDVTVRAGDTEVTAPITTLWQAGLRKFPNSDAAKAFAGWETGNP